MLRKSVFGALAIGIVLGSSAVSYAGGEPKELRACTSCHFLDKGADVKKNNLGQGLKGVFGRKISVTGAEKLGDVWTEEALNTWLSDPRAVKPGTKMTFKQKSEEKRKAVIEALKTL